MPFFERQNFRMHYEIHEGLVPQDTLAIHGNLASNAWWQPMVEELKRQNKPAQAGRLICAEWRGCGKSNNLIEESQLNLSEIADDYNGLMRALRVNQAAVIGHSTGGLIALHAMRSAPELYGRALLLDSVGATGVQFGPEMYDAFTAMSRDRGICEAVMTGTIHGGLKNSQLLQQIVSDAFQVHPFVWHGVAKMLHATDFRSELAHIRQPVLVLHGEFDTLLPKEASQALAQALPNGRFLELAERGHSSNVEDPELFVRHVNQFLFG